MKKNDLFTFGEIMAVFLTASNQSLEFEQNYLLQAAGAEANVSVAVTNLGLSVKFLSKVGSDKLGMFVISKLREYGINTNHIKEVKSPTGLMIRNFDSHRELETLYYRKNSAGSTLSENDIRESDISNSRWLHITGISMAISENSYLAVLKAAKIAQRNKICVSLDLNIRKKLWTDEEAAKKIKTILPYVNFLFGGVKEYKIVWNHDSSERNLRAASEFGIENCIMTNGEEKIQFISGKVFDHYSPIKVETQDSVGAGDAFVGGTIAGILGGMKVADAIEQGSQCGAIVASSIGDWNRKIAGKNGILKLEGSYE
jgi:2-dehydro-3-deoxygluconokinase